jgi:hypothetical protein
VAFRGPSGVVTNWPQLLDPYLKSASLHFCPTDTQAKTNSYGLNELAFTDLTDDVPAPSVRLNAFKTPTVLTRSDADLSQHSTFHSQPG